MRRLNRVRLLLLTTRGLLSNDAEEAEAATCVRLATGAREHDRFSLAILALEAHNFGCDLLITDDNAVVVR